MSLAGTLIRKVDSLLTKYATPSSTVYKRTVTRTGGDPLTGRSTSVATVDVLLSPQPMYSRNMRMQIGGSDAEGIVTNSSLMVAAQSFEMVMSPNAISLTELQNPDTLLVFKDALNNSEIYRIDDYEPFGVNSQTVGWLVYATSMSR